MKIDIIYYSDLHQLALVAFVLVLLEKWVVDQLLYGCALVGILLKAFVEEVSDLIGDEEIGGDFDLVLYYLYELFLACDFKGIFTHHHFVHHNADRPDVNFLVVLASLEDLRADVEWGSAESGPQFVVLMN
jgi:hypothetical protein